MDPVTIIVAALVAGAASGFNKVAAQAIEEGYAGIKTLIKDRYKRVPVEMLENDPNNEGRQDILQQDLIQAGAGKDPELLAQAKALLEAVREHDPETAQNITVNLVEGEIDRDVDIDTLIAEAGSIDINAERIKVKLMSCTYSGV